MKKISVLALVAGLAAAACSSHGNTALTPSGSNPSQMGSGRSPQSLSTSGVSQFGMQSMKAQALAVPPAGWASTATLPITPANASDLGALSPSQSITVRVGLQLRNVDQLKQAIAGGQEIDPGSFNAAYAPTTTQVNAVTAYLSSQGFSNISVEPNNVIVSASASAANVSKAFNTSLDSFSQNGSTIYANTAPAYVPASLSGTVVAVLGLNNAQAMKPTPKQPTPCSFFGVGTPAQACLRFYDPSTYSIAYDAGKTPTGHATNVAIMTEGSLTQSISDFRLNEQQFNLPQANIKIVPVGLPSTDTAGATEWTLDMTYSTGMAGAVQQLYLYNTTSLTDSDIALMYSRWATDDLSKIGNSSFGGCEFFSFLDGSMVIMDEILAQGAVQGQTMFVSSGDSGSFCGVAASANGVPAGAPFVEYPAASPYSNAVGGTDLFTNADGTYKGETAWEAGGGGISQFEYSPYWETAVQPVDNAGSFRGVPDVAMDAALETGALLWGGQATNGSCTPCVTGGTSLASPLSAGVWARLQTAHGNHLGFAPLRLYHNFTSHAAGAVQIGPPAWQPDGGFHDILNGANGLYQALPGYDYTTGLGSFDIAIMNAQIGN